MSDIKHRTSHGRDLMRGAGIVGVLTLLSRLLGFARDLLVARLLGTGAAADAFNVAFRIPNLLRSIFAEGALTSAFVPVITGEIEQSHAQARETIRGVTTLLIAATAVLSGLGILYAPDLVDLLAPGFQSHGTVGPIDKYRLCVDLTRIMLPYIIFVSIVAMLNGALNSVRVFGASALAQVLMNIVLIVGALYASGSTANDATIILAWSVIAGGTVQILAQLPMLTRAGFSLRPALACWTPPIRQMVRLMVPAIFGAAIYQLTMFVATALASLAENGAVSWLFYADRLTQLPIGIFSIALGSVLLPLLAGAHARKSDGEFGEHLVNSLRFTSFFIIPTCALMALCAEPLVSLLFQRGAFDSHSSVQTAAAVVALAPGIWGASCHSLLARGLIARKDTVTTTLVGLGSLVVTTLVGIGLMGDPLPEARDLMAEFVRGVRDFLSFLPLFSLGHVGIALASSTASLYGALTLGYLLKKRMPSLSLAPFARATLQTVVASAAGFGVAFIGAGGNLALLALLFSATFLIVSRVLASRELQETFAAFQRYLGKKRA